MRKLLLTILALALLTPTITYAQFSVPQGGTGRNSFTPGDFIYANSDAFQRLTGTSSPYFANFTFGNATGTSATTTNLFSTNSIFTNATSTNLFSTNASFTNLTSSGVTLSGFTNGSILFATSSGVISQDNSNFFWDDVNDRLGIGTSSPSQSLTVGNNNQFTVSSGGDVTAASTIAVGTTPATTGVIRLPNAQSIVWRNAANDDNITGIQVDGDNNLNLLASNWQLTSTALIRLAATEATAGNIRLGNNDVIAWRNSGNTADHTLTLGNTAAFSGNASIGGTLTMSNDDIILQNNARIRGASDLHSLLIGTSGSFNWDLNSVSSMRFAIDTDASTVGSAIFGWYANSHDGAGTLLMSLNEDGTLAQVGNATIGGTLGVTGILTGTQGRFSVGSGTGVAITNSNTTFQTTYTPIVELAHTSAPNLMFYVATGGTDEKVWDISTTASGKNFAIRARGDTTGTTNAINIVRSGTSISSITLGGPTTVSGTLGVTGTTTLATTLQTEGKINFRTIGGTTYNGVLEAFTNNRTTYLSSNLTYAGAGSGGLSSAWFYTSSTGDGAVLQLDGDSADRPVGLSLYTAPPSTGVGANPASLPLEFRISTTSVATDNIVGIGTYSPSTQLEMSANNNGATTNNTLRITDTDTTTQTDQVIGQIQFFGNDASGPGAGIKSALRAISTNTSGGSYFTISTSNTSSNDLERVRVTENGNVGIGTTSPSSLLHVYRSGGQTSAVTQTTVENLITSGTGVQVIANDWKESSTGSNSIVGKRIAYGSDADATNNNYVYSRNFISTDAGSTYQIGGFDLSASNDFDTANRFAYLYTSSVPIVFTANAGISNITTELTSANAQMILTTGGLLGIGTTSPSQLFTVGNNNQFTVSSTGIATTTQLVVTGTTTFNGAVRDVTNSTGTSGQVLTSTGTSTLWATSSGGGLTYNNGTTTVSASSTATTTIAHGLGSAPDRVRITSLYGTGGSDTNEWSTEVVYSNSKQAAVYKFVADRVSGSGFAQHGFAFQLGYNSDNIRGVISVDATNIYIVWTLTGAGWNDTANLMWEAET